MSCNRDSELEFDLDLVNQEAVEVLFSSEKITTNFPKRNKFKVSQSIESSVLDEDIITSRNFDAIINRKINNETEIDYVFQ